MAAGGTVAETAIISDPARGIPKESTRYGPCVRDRPMANNITSYRDLIVWQKALDLADLVYTLTERFPKREQFGLAFQMRKASVSVPSNIAEGHRHRTPGYIARVIIALGEHAELETQALLARRRNYIRTDDMETLNALATQVGELAHGLLRSLEARQASQSNP